MQYVRVAAHGLIRNGDKFLVTRRAFDDDYMPGYWDIPGGTIKFHEKAEDALRREIKEEAGLDVEIGNILFCYDFPSGSERHQFQLVYECKYINGEVKLDPETHDDFKWVDINDSESLKKIAFLEALCKYLIN